MAMRVGAFESPDLGGPSRYLKETGQNPGPNFHFSEKVQIMHSTIFFKIHVFPRKYIIPLQTEGENDGNGMNDVYITL